MESHQFRINKDGESDASATPEGVHRDGRDYVLIMMINRINLLGGKSYVFELNEAIQNKQLHEIGDNPEYLEHQDILHSVTLSSPGEFMILDDKKVLHAVTQLQKNNPEHTAYRDVFVLTCRPELEYQKVVQPKVESMIRDQLSTSMIGSRHTLLQTPSKKEDVSQQDLETKRELFRV